MAVFTRFLCIFLFRLWTKYGIYSKFLVPSINSIRLVWVEFQKQIWLNL